MGFGCGGGTGRHKGADVGCDDGTEVGAEALEVGEVLRETRVGGAEGKEGFPRGGYLWGTVAEVEGVVLEVVGGHVGSGRRLVYVLDRE